MKKNQNLRAIQAQRFLRYSIRKFTVGVASVAIASGLAVLGGTNVQAAAEEVVNTHATETKAPETGKNIKTEVAEKVNTSKLSEAIARLEAALEKAASTEKTASAIESAKAELANAKAVAANEAATKEEVAKATSEVNGKAFVVESMPKATADKKEEKENKNQDSRNGQAIPGKGESGFRDTGTVADSTENPVVVNTNDITQKASELEAEIAKVESLISAEIAKGEGKTDKELVGILTQVKESAQAVKNKGNNIPTTEKEKHALLQELKEKVDLLKLYQAKKLDWGAPANNHLANYGNNPSDAVISNLNDTFGTPDFSNATSHTKRAENQASGINGAINLGSATYHWKQKEITVDEAKAGALGGWKIVDKEGANTVNIVKPEVPTDIEYKEGQSATTYAPKPAKVYDNNGHVTATGGQNRPNASGGVLRYMISTDRLGNESIGKVNKDYYVELKKQGTTIYKDFDVNPNSHLYANLVFSSAYGKLGLTSSGEKIKMKIVDAYTGQPLSELTRKDGKASDTEFIGQPGSDSDGFAALWRVVKVPEGTTKVRVFVEAGDQPTTSDYLNGHKVEDGYIVAGLGLTPGPALTLTTTVVSGKNKEAYGYTEDSIYKNAQKGTFNVTLSNNGGVGVVYQTRYEVTLKVPKGVKLGTLYGTDLNEVNGKSLFAPSYTYDFKYNKDTRELTFKIDLPKRDINPTSGKSNTVTIPFEVTPDFVGEATFEVVGKNGFGGKDKLGNMILPYGIVGSDRYNIPVNVNANSLETSDNPEYKYNRSIYIDSMTGNSTITVPVGTTFEKAKEAAKVSAEELLNSEAYREKLATLKATAALNLSETSLIAMVQGYSTAAVKENSGTLKVPVIHTVGSKKFNNQIDINVNVVASTEQQKVVFEGDTIQNDDIKEKITPATIPGYTATTNNVQNMPTTTGKAGQIINVETTVSYTKGNVVLPETVTVPVLVLPKPNGEEQVHKGASVDKVKEVAKSKAQTLVEAADFKGKLPTGATVTVGDVTEAVAETLTNEKGTNKGVVNVPATYTVDGKTYNTTIPVTINVLGSEPKTVYTLEGTKLEAEKVKAAVTPGTGGTVNTPKETDLPATTVKAGTPDVTVPTTVTYPTGDETVNVPVEVLPKATPEKVTTLKDTTSDNLTTAVKEKAQAALGKLTLPSGVTVELDPNQTYAVPATDSNGDKTAVPVKVQYKDATGTVVAEDTINVPVTVVSSTPSKVVVFEGENPTADQAKAAVTAGTDGTKGEPTTLPETAGKAGTTDVKVDVPVTYDNGKLTETVSVPVIVLPKATGEADVPKGSTVDKVKEVAKAKATALVAATDFTGKLPTGATVTVGDITETVAETLTNEKGPNKGVVNVPATYTVEGKTYNTTIPVTINVLGSEPKTVYTVEGTKPDAEKVKNAVSPGTGGTVGTPTETDLPETTGKVGAKDVTAITTVTYPSGTETVNVPVEVLPKATPEKVTTLKDTTADNLTTAVKEKAQAALGKLTLPSGVTAELDPNQTYAVPATDSNGDKTAVPVKVQYKDATGTVVAEDTISVPVTVVSSTPSKIVVFEGETPTAEQAKAAVTPGTDGTKGEPTTLPETAGKAGATDVKVDVPVTYDNGKLTETVSVPVTVLPKPEAEEILVAKNSDKEKAKEKVLAKAKKAIEDSTFTGKLPQGATVTVDETATITVPDLTEDMEVDVPVKYTVDGQEKTTTVKVPVTVVESVPQIVPVKETNDVLPDPEKSIDKTDYPEGSTFRYKTPEGQTTPIDVTTPGDKDVIVEVLDKNGNPIVEVPATVRVVESYPKYVPVDPAKKQPDPKENINPNDFPTGTTFEYKDNTPVDTTTPGEKPVTVVAKLNGQPITEIPATIVVVEPKTQYVPVNAENDKKPKPQDSITPDDYPEGSTFEYKTPEGQTTPYDGTTPGEKDVTVVVKDSDGDTIVEVPAKIKVVQGKEQLTPVNAEDKDKPKAEDSITPSDYPEGSTFEYKVPEGQTTPYDGTTPGDKPVTVVVKDKDGKVLVEVPATIKVVESKPTPIETPVTNTPLTQDDYTKGMKIPEGATVKVGDLPDLTTPGEKTPVEVKITLKNGKSYTVKVPVNVTPIKEIETPVTTDKLTPEDILKQIKVPDGATAKVGDLPELTTPGKKDPVKVTVTLPNGKVVTVEVPVNVTPITPIETPVTKDKLTPEDILKQIKVPDGATVKVGNIPELTTPGKKDPVKVTITLPNGKVVTVEVPVNVTPIKDIVKKQGDPITEEDVEKHIPKGAKVISIGDKPTTDVPGERPSIPVVIELPNGIRVTMDIPVIVTPKVTPVVVSVGTPVTPEDVEKHIELPKGWKVTKVGEIPTTETPGAKPVVKVEIELPDGRKITVDVPVIVTPTVRQIVVPQGTPITPDDVKGHIDLPKEPGWEIVEVGEIPTTIPAGVKPSVKVKIKVPTGEIIEVDVPVIVTPKVTPIVVEVGTPITEEDVKKKVDLPEGWEIVEVGEIPTTETPGAKPVVKVKVKLPDGRIITVDVPVTVTPKSQNGGGAIAQNGDSTVQIVTEYLDENGNRITSDKEGKHNPIELEGYEFSHSTTDAKGNTLHHYKKVTPKAPQAVEEVPTTKQEQPSTPEVKSTPVAKQELPNTGTAELEVFTPAVLAILAGLGLATPTVAKKKDEE